MYWQQTLLTIALSIFLITGSVGIAVAIYHSFKENNGNKR